MDFHPASVASVIAFRAIVAVVVAAFLWAVHRAYGRGRVLLLTMVALFVWLGALTGLIASGRMESLPLHGLPLFFAPILVIAIATALTTWPIASQMPQRTSQITFPIREPTPEVGFSTTVLPNGHSA